MLRYYIIKTTALDTRKEARPGARIPLEGRIISAPDDQQAKELALAYVASMQRSNRSVLLVDVVPYPASPGSI
jgi:hypothetical protein